MKTLSGMVCVQQHEDVHTTSNLIYSKSVEKVAKTHVRILNLKQTKHCPQPPLLPPGLHTPTDTHTNTLSHTQTKR